VPRPPTSRQATTRDLDHVTACIAMAFADDPVWGPALRPADGSTSHLLPYWRLFVDGAHRFGTVRMTPGGEAVSVWLPPGMLDELSGAGAAAFERLLDDEGDPAWRADLDQLYERFAASRHGLADHYYLSLLATHHEHRGKGIGQALLAADLALWDAEGAPAYLESTNPANDHRYQRAGFRSIGGFQAVRGGGWVNAMWRDPTPT
jgi:GNAT superfamily N-acetyltransferase